MDDAKARFLFGEVPEDVDLDDEDERSLALDDPSATPALQAMIEVLANQIADDRPPETWLTAQRLLDGGMERATARAELIFAIAYAIRTVLSKDEPFDEAGYVDLLSRLPLPNAKAAAEAMIGNVRQGPAIHGEELMSETLAALGREPDDALVRDMLEHVLDDLIDAGQLAYLTGDRVVHVGDLVRDIVLTHRLSEEEIASGCLDVAVDLAGFAQRDDLKLAGGEPVGVDVVEEDRATFWSGPEGWLAPFSAGAVLAVRVREDGTISVEQVDEPALDDELVGRVGAAFDREAGTEGIPLSAADLAVSLLFDDADTFSEPRPPLSELCRAAGLETAGNLVAGDPEAWARREVVVSLGRLQGRLDDEDDRRVASQAFIVFLDPSSSPAELRSALGGLRRREPLTEVVEELIGRGASDELARAGDVVGRLLKAARHPDQVAVAQWIAAVVAERAGSVLDAETHVRAAVSADPLWEPAVDRAAWYAFDRGDAATATELWGRLGEERAELDLLEDLDTPEPARLPGRNEACWCGSGPKFKHCHLGRPALPPLPDRVSWLFQKAISYLERAGDEAADDLFGYAGARAADPESAESLAEALRDPIVTDTALVEGGWFREFLDERGPLLPKDEAILAEAWALVARTVYEVVEVRVGSGITVRDLATGDRIDVSELAFTGRPKEGWLVCGRAVPDGEGHQFVGGLLPVLPGTESEVQELCQAEDGVGLCSYAGRRFRPPV